jgi:p-aminobenzoyl-glutamate transporter AbgT
MLSQKYYVNEYKGFFWSEGLVMWCVCVCIFVCARSIDPRKEEVNKAMYNTVNSEKIQKYNNYIKVSQEKSMP